LRAVEPKHRLAASCIHRVSFLLAEGDEANAETAEACPTVPPKLVRALVNSHGKTLVHLDPRDAGSSAKLLGSSAAVAAGIEIITHKHAQPPPPDAPPDFLQTVVILYRGCSENEALAVVGLSAEEVSGIFQAPISGPEEICMAIYLIDFSTKFHGNPRNGLKLPLGAWAFRATPYVTVHGATWAARVDKMPVKEAEAFLSCIAGLPGYKPLRGREPGDDPLTPLGWDDDDVMQPSRSEAARELARAASSTTNGWVELEWEGGESAVGQVHMSADALGPRWWVVTPGSQWYPLNPTHTQLVVLGSTRSQKRSVVSS